MSDCVLTPAYPADFPLEAAKVVIATVRGQEEVAHGIHAGWVLLGFGCGHFLPCDPLVVGGTDNQEERLARLLEQAIEVKNTPPDQLKGVAIPWDQIVQLVMLVLASWLTKK